MEVMGVKECNKLKDETLKVEKDISSDLKVEEDICSDLKVEEDNNSDLKVEKESSSDKKVVYDSSGDEYDSQEQRELFHAYQQQIQKSDGFDVDFVPDFVFVGGVYPVNLSRKGCNLVKWAWESVSMAINDHNNKTKGEKLKLVDMEKANVTGSFIFYITLEARGIVSGEINRYQAEVYYDPFEGEHEVHFLRPRIENGSEEVIKVQQVTAASTPDGRGG